MILEILCAYVLVINIVLFAMMGIDKRRAIHGAWRIPEKTLFLTAALGGSIGGMLGMRVFRHKTKHWSFRLGFPAILIAQIALIYGIVYLLGK